MESPEKRQGGRTNVPTSWGGERDCTGQCGSGRTSFRRGGGRKPDESRGVERQRETFEWTKPKKNSGGTKGQNVEYWGRGALVIESGGEEGLRYILQSRKKQTLGVLQPSPGK